MTAPIFTPKKLAFVRLSSTVTDVYDSPSTAIGEIHNILLCNANTTTEAVVLNMHDGTNSYPIFKASLLAGETVILQLANEGLIIDGPSKITGSSTTSAMVTCLICGSERS